MMIRKTQKQMIAKITKKKIWNKSNLKLMK